MRHRNNNLSTIICSEGACFSAGTLVTLNDGNRKSIEQLAVGDLVSAFRGIADRTVSRKINEIVIREGQTVYELRTEDNRVVWGTGNHPFLVGPNKTDPMMEDLPVRYKALKDLTPTDRLVGQAGSIIRISSVQMMEGEHTVYNLIVDGLRSYVVNGIRVHGCRCDPNHRASYEDDWF
ncbi:MAG: hypothetical protein K1X44_03745 [Alphaproteobacteria bacterium]|nr:hypothetical protein [Alphaproteobacteria bacterium]